MGHSREIIDFHTHIGTAKAATYEERGEQEMINFGKNTEGLQKYLDDNAISKAVVFALPMLPHMQKGANDEVLELVSGNPRFVPFAFLDPRLKESPQLLKEYVEKGCKGMKLHPICHGYVVSNTMTYPTMEAAQELNIPVLIHTGWGEYGEIRFIKKLAEDFQDLKIVIGHMIEYQDIFTIVPTLENVSVETSYSSHPRRITQAVKALGADRVIFGSDMPLGVAGFELLKVTMAPISDESKEKILFQNASRLLKLNS